MKRRYANQVPGDYIREHIDTNYFTGYVCYTKIKNIDTPKYVNDGIKEFCIIDNDYEWFQLYPDNNNYVLTIMLDNNRNIIQWYFDVSKNVGIENGIPYEDDLYLDMVITNDEKKLILDEDELLEAYNSNEISQNDVDAAYKIIEYLDNKYYQNIGELKEFTEKLKIKYRK